MFSTARIVLILKGFLPKFSSTCPWTVEEASGSEKLNNKSSSPFHGPSGDKKLEPAACWNVSSAGLKPGARYV